MLSQLTLTTLLLTLLLASSAEARISNPLNAKSHGSFIKKHPIPEANPNAEPQPIALAHPIGLEKIRRDAASNLEARASGDKTMMKKRKVLKRKSGQCVIATPEGNVTSTFASSLPASTSASSIPAGAAIATGGTTPTSTSTSTSATPTPSSSYNSPWYLVADWSGSTFFNNWQFWDYSDPTHGTVQYVDVATAWNEGLVSINSAGNPVMKVDTTQQVSGGRKSVRLHGYLTYTGGLVVLDAVHMPAGCGTWPAWWSNGPNWPAGGEIDILEGVNAFTQNQVSLHTNSGCTMPGNLNQKGSLTTGNYNSYDCGSANTANQGCGVRDTSAENSYGAPFNANGGGVYAMQWAASGINVWFFPRGSIPADLTANQPVPSGWGTPVANFPSTYCSPYQFFYDHFPIFDTTFCGDWAGADGVWNYAGYAGQDQSCAASTGYSTCADYVLNQGSKFTEAYWEINYVKFFNSTSQL